MLSDGAEYGDGVVFAFPAVFKLTFAAHLLIFFMHHVAFCLKLGSVLGVFSFVLAAALGARGDIVAAYVLALLATRAVCNGCVWGSLPGLLVSSMSEYGRGSKPWPSHVASCPGLDLALDPRF